MPERLIQIPIRNETREQLKSIKGIATYDQFITELIQKKAGESLSTTKGDELPV